MESKQGCLTLIASGLIALIAVAATITLVMVAPVIHKILEGLF